MRWRAAGGLRSACVRQSSAWYRRVMSCCVRDGPAWRARTRSWRRPAVGMWCSGDARCGGGWRRPARRGWRTSSCGAWRARWTRARPAPRARRANRTSSSHFAWPYSEPSATPSCEILQSCANFRSAPTVFAATLTTGADSVSPVRQVRLMTRATSASSKRCRIARISQVGLFSK